MPFFLSGICLFINWFSGGGFADVDFEKGFFNWVGYVKKGLFGVCTFDGVKIRVRANHRVLRDTVFTK